MTTIAGAFGLPMVARAQVAGLRVTLVDTAGTLVRNADVELCDATGKPVIAAAEIDSTTKGVFDVLDVLKKLRPELMDAIAMDLWAGDGARGRILRGSRSARRVRGRTESIP